MSQFDEPDDDAARMANTFQKWCAMQVGKMLAIKESLTQAERGQLRDLDTRICVLRQAATDTDIAWLRKVAWKYRRALPRAQAPKLNPEDPIVMEMEKRQ